MTNTFCPMSRRLFAALRPTSIFRGLSHPAASPIQRRGVRTLPAFSLEGKTAMVTGASRGLGKEILTAFALSGANGACIDLDQAAADASCNSIEHEVLKVEAMKVGSVPKLRGYQCNVTSEEGVKSTVARIIQDFGKIDILATAAGVVENFDAEKYPFANLKRMMDINFNGSFLCAKEVGGHMIDKDIGGRIIFVSSMSAFVVNRPQNQVAYNASKAAVSHMMRSMAAEWAPKGIRVNSIAPGYQKTKLIVDLLAKEGDISPKWIADTPMGRMCNPEEIRGAAVFLASDASSFVTGHDLVVDGGYMCW